MKPQIFPKPRSWQCTAKYAVRASESIPGEDELRRNEQTILTFPSQPQLAVDRLLDWCQKNDASIEIMLRTINSTKPDALNTYLRFMEYAYAELSGAHLILAPTGDQASRQGA